MSPALRLKIIDNDILRDVRMLASDVLEEFEEVRSLGQGDV